MNGQDGVGPRTGLVIVSHSARLADGVVELAAQMAPDVLLRPAGGTDDGRIGTSFAKVSDAVSDLLEAGCEVVLLTDLGSATMTAEMVLEMLPEFDRERVVLADGPLVEGAVAAAVAAQTGAEATEVVGAIARAGASFAHGPDRRPAATEGVRSGPGESVERLVVVADPSGLHARPAAALAQRVAAMDADVTVDGVDAASPLDLMGLGLRGGRQVTVRATGPDADLAAEEVARALATWDAEGGPRPGR